MGSKSPPSDQKPILSPKKKSKDQTGYLQGQILVAMPQMQDPRFKEALILICGHDDDGAMGLIMNKPLREMTVKDVIDQLDLENADQIPELDLYYGGPVEIGRGFVLHSAEYMNDTSVAITDDIALTASTLILQDVVDQEGPDHLLMALGYAGWSAGQLETEVLQNGWLILPADASILFDEHPETLWERTLKRFGIDPDCLSIEAGRA